MEKSVIERMEDLEGRLAAQQEEIAAQQEEIAAQRAQLGAQGAEIARLRAEGWERVAAALASPTGWAARRRGRRARRTGEGSTPAPADGGQTSRRGLLKLGGVAAAGVAAAGAGGLLRPGVARADGVPWQTGVVNADNQTFVEPANGSFRDPVLLAVRLGTAAPYLPLTNPNSAAIAAYDTTVVGASGLYASSSAGIAVFGESSSGSGVNGASVSGVGVYGQSVSDGTGVYGFSVTGIGGRFQGGAAQLWLVPAFGEPGAPTSGTHSQGELYMDGGATLWMCVGAGTPGTWRQVAAQAPGYAGGSLNLLPTPIRLLDTRLGAPVGNLRPNAPVAYHGTLNVPAAGVTYLSQTIPAGAVAVFGLLTAALAPGVNCGDGSSAIAYATGSTRPAAVNVVFNPGDLHGAYTSDFTLVRTGANGDISLYSQPILPGVAVDYLFDCFGFVI